MKTLTVNSPSVRKILMLLPVFLVPVVLLIFGTPHWSLPQTGGSDNGLNATLPDARLDDEQDSWNKLNIYNKAQQDSTRFNEAKRSDPYFHFSTLITAATHQDTTKKNNINHSLGKRPLAATSNEELVRKKLEDIYKQIQAPVKNTHVVSDTRIVENEQLRDNDVDRLEKIMSEMNDSGEEDPEMKQIENVLDKILDIQHPNRVKRNTPEQAQQTQALPVTLHEESENISLLAGDSKQIDSTAIMSYQVWQNQNGFYSWEEEGLTYEASDFNAIEAVIHQEQTVVSGSTVKIRLLRDVVIQGIRIPKDQFIYGSCQINGERLTITLKSIRLDNAILPVSLSVYDLDGMEGIYIPGAITRDAAKQASGQAVNDMQLYSLDASLGMQAASAGMEAAKGLLTKKSKLIKVTVKAGYKILLHNESNSKV